MTETASGGFKVDLARKLMGAYCIETGLVGEAPIRRYLWTDAFAVCNYLALHRRTGESRYFELALRLVDQVHHVLGRHRPDDSRTGWISGLPEAEGERHPTRGGLRIGKDLPERGLDQPFDPRLEWERDGQYFHYLTKWMHALQRVALETGNATFHGWAVELAEAAHAGFFRAGAAGGPKRMIWKAGIGLDRALVPSMGHHDPLDALLTFLDLASHGEEGLQAPIRDAMAICSGARWATEDALGIGGLLTDVYRLAVLVLRRGVDHRPLLYQLVEDSVSSLDAFARSGLLRMPLDHRLAFRELGLSIGLHATEKLGELGELGDLIREDPDLMRRLAGLEGYLPLAEHIESAWSDAAPRQSRTWVDHQGINAVMLATSLVPGGFLAMG